MAHRKRDDERTPLLSHTDEASSSAGAHLSIPQLFAALGALKTGKLPSSTQFSSLLTALLESPLLQPQTTLFEPKYGSGRLGVGTLTKEGENVRRKARKVMEATVDLLRKDVVKEDGIQDFFWACKKSELDLEMPSAPPLPTAEGVDQATHSLSSLFTVFFTSPQLRALAIDLLLLFKSSIQAQVSTSVGVELGAVFGQAVDAVVVDVTGSQPAAFSSKGKERAEDSGRFEEVFHEEDARADKPVIPEGMPPGADQKAATMSPDEMRDEFIDRFTTILTQIQKTPAYRSAISTILNLIRGYYNEATSNITPSASIDAPSSTSDPLSLFLPLLATFSGGPSSLAPLLTALHELKTHLAVPTSRLRSLMLQLDTFLTNVLLQPRFLTSAASNREMQRLYETFQSLSTAPEGPNPLPAVVQELEGVVVRISQDPELGGLAKAGEEMGEAVARWVEKMGEVAVGKSSVWGDVVEFLLPRFLAMLGEVPLPRIEFTSPAFDAAVDAPPFVATSFVPDLVHVETHSEFFLYPTEPPPAPPKSRFLPSFLMPPPSPHPSAQMTTNSRLSIKGLRFQALNIGYFAKYKPTYLCFPLVEAGLLDLLIGSPTGQGGLDVVINFSFDSDTFGATEGSGQKRLFHLVNDPLTTLTSFAVNPHQSSHPLILWMLRPILRTVVRSQVEKLLAEKVEALLEWAGRVGWEVRRKAHAEGGSKMAWTSAFVTTVVQGVDETVEEKVEREKKEHEAQIEQLKKAKEEAKQVAEGKIKPDDEESALHVSAKGVSYDLAPHDAETGESSMVVGVGREGVVIPVGEAETPVARLSAGEIVSHAAQDVVDDGKAAAGQLVGGVKDVLEGVGEFQETVKEEQAEEGWRSAAFDF